VPPAWEKGEVHLFSPVPVIRDENMAKGGVASFAHDDDAATIVDLPMGAHCSAVVADRPAEKATDVGIRLQTRRAEECRRRCSIAAVGVASRWGGPTTRSSTPSLLAVPADLGVGLRLAVMNDIQRRRLLISGRVQGVYFRDSVRSEAAAAGVSGSAHNLSDGRVEVVLEGEATAVDQVIEWCRTGPPRARVDGIEVVSEPPQGESGFVIG
jgi:acylphosphatase